MFNLIFIVMAFDPLNFATGLGTNMLFNSINQNQYRDNQRFAQQLAQENAMFQDNLTRKLTRDTPVLERQGLVNAGINPAMLKDGTMAAQQGAQVNQSPVNTAPYFSDSVPSYTSLLQSSLVSSEIDKNVAEAKNKMSDTEYKNVQTKQLSEYVQYQGSILKNNIAESITRQNLNKDHASQLKALADKTVTEWQILLPKAAQADKFTDAEYDTMQKNIAKLDAEIDNLKKQGDLFVEQKNTEVTKQSLNKEQVNTEKTKQSLNMSQAAYVALQAVYQNIINQFAEKGIFPNSAFGGIAALLTSGKAGEIVDQLNDFITTSITKVVDESIPKVLGSVLGSLRNLPEAAMDAIVKGVTEPKPKGKGNSNK